MAKKIGRALGRGEAKDAARLERTLTPKITLDHIIKERYPTFIDALRDLDDALSMLFLFANLPSSASIPPKTTALCQRLCLEFQHYLILTHSLRKSFLSIKGIYYQATIQGQDILWLVPYKFVQRTEEDIDFRIMATFVEFYTTLLGFINFRLYNSIGLIYPPRFNASKDDSGAELGAFTLEGKTITDQPATKALTNGVNGASHSNARDAQAEADKLAALPALESDTQASTNLELVQTSAVEEDHTAEAIDTFEPTASDADILPQPSATNEEIGNLFSECTFFLSRETPRAPLEFLLKSFGCKRVGWDAVLGDGAFTHDESDRNITHQIADRPNLPEGALPEVHTDVAPAQEGVEPQTGGRLRPGTRVPGRTYVQPQWVWDCINQNKLLRPDLYAPGATLPPHLSPWVKPKRGEYDPTATLAEQEKEGEAEKAEIAAEAAEEAEIGENDLDEEDEDDDMDDDEDVEEETGMKVADDEESDEEDEDESEQEQGGADFAGFSDEEPDAGEDAELQHQRELEAEARGVPISNGRQETENEKVVKAAAKKRRERDEEMERQKMMMSRKKRKMLERITFGNEKREVEAERLRAKRRALEKA